MCLHVDIEKEGFKTATLPAVMIGTYQWEWDLKTIKKESYLCKRCDGEFPTQRLLSKHRKEKHLQEYDDRQFFYTYSHLDAMYSCNTCDVEFTKKEEVEKHILCHEQKYECPMCRESFHSPYKYSVHTQKHTKGPFFCPLCQFKTKRVTSILQHINRLHLRRFLYYCRHCGKGFCDALTYKEHEQNHIAARPVVCVVCKKEFLFSRYLTHHQIRSHVPNILGITPKNQCDFCRKSYSKKETLERHLKTVHTNTPRPKTHLCDNCGKGFPTKNKLTVHFRIHTGYKPYKCSYCEKCFTKKDYLVMHERIHSGEKPYCCQYCGKCFNQGASLKIHNRTHTGERPYICRLCGNGCISSASLKIHMHSCNGPDNKYKQNILL